MSNLVLTRRTFLGSGLEADLAALRDTDSTPVPVTHPTEDVDTLIAQGDSFTFDSFTTADAFELGHFLHARLSPDPRPALISITLANGLTIFQAVTGSGVQPDNEVWAERKRRTVLRWGCSTWRMHCKFGGDEALFASKFGMGPDQAGQYAIHGGGVPIYVRDVEGLVAVVVVSGLKQHEDHGVIVGVVHENWEVLD